MSWTLDSHPFIYDWEKSMLSHSSLKMLADLSAKDEALRILEAEKEKGEKRIEELTAALEQVILFGQVYAYWGA